jgi:hypothetical protein
VSATESDRGPEPALAALAAELAPALVAEARSEAVEKVRAELVARLSAALMRECEARLAGAKAPDALVEPLRDEGFGYYVYGVVGSSARLPEDLAGVDPDGAVRVIDDDGLAAIVSQVPMAEFGEERIRENLNDVSWLEDTARSHERVLEAVLGRTAVVPLRICTVFAGERQVVEMLSAERSLFRDALARLAGKAEWGVKAFADSVALEAEAISRSVEPGAETDVSPGTAYMDRRRQEARAQEAAEEVADEWADRLHTRLAGTAAEALLNPLQRPELSGHEGVMLMNGVYLVPDQEADRFGEVVAELRDEFDRKGVEIVLTGPWPAYNFVKSSIEAAR